MLGDPAFVLVLLSAMAADPQTQLAPTTKRSGYLSRVRETIDGTLEFVRDMTKGLPSWSKPLVTSATLLFMSVVLVVMVPLSPWLRRGMAARLAPVRSLEAHVRRVWGEESPRAGLELLRRVRQDVKAGGWNDVVVPPYGTFDQVWARVALEDLAYRFEVSLQNWKEALQIAEENLQSLTEEKAQVWVLSKARCLVRLGRTPEAKELLLRHRDPQHRNSEVNRMLDELRQSSSRGSA